MQILIACQHGPLIEKRQPTGGWLNVGTEKLESILLQMWLLLDFFLNMNCL